MLAVPQLIRNRVRQSGVRQTIIEKDYALSYLMAAVDATEGLGSCMVLKGGTALKKLYFPDYRFSEDLDYSTRVPGRIEQIDSLMSSAIQTMEAQLNERGPFIVQLQTMELNRPHPRDQVAYVIRVQFPDQRQPLCRLKMEITIDEPVIRSTETRQIQHTFPEEFSVSVPVYSLMEITAEKLRALLQSRAKVRVRGWGASRVCRDYYDLWHLLPCPGVSSPELISLLDQKCIVRDVHYRSPQDFLAEELLTVARAEWSQQLLPLVQDAPGVDHVLSQVERLIIAIWE